MINCTAAEKKKGGSYVCCVAPNVIVSALGWKLQEQNIKLVSVQICVSTCRVLARARHGWTHQKPQNTCSNWTSNVRYAAINDGLSSSRPFTRLHYLHVEANPLTEYWVHTKQHNAHFCPATALLVWICLGHAVHRQGSTMSSSHGKTWKLWQSWRELCGLADRSRWKLTSCQLCTSHCTQLAALDDQGSMDAF